MDKDKIYNPEPEYEKFDGYNAVLYELALAAFVVFVMLIGIATALFGGL